MEPKIFRTHDGTEIEITQDMLDDFNVLSHVYGISIRNIIGQFLDAVTAPNIET
ncbi:hypothetical protein [Clostridium thailandense]|uniref:hypothetical protein n=1 Tax=Clostridium thailandense TaxID=2794346 RepID=UPI0039899CCC